ncbi:TPA: hypothetical protein PSJ20_001890 [Staphylococcus aureus]|nr:hypothetical protein [Staphylococcus aureus]HDH6407720.1 hypothetical protein [Staphylococcus aureus MRSA-Lux-40]AJP23160.1 hypothetical protein UC16_10415 [Staphylococcus aureus]ATZ14802.1 hypothetical protein CU118_07805 [Staphylococcus aureus]EJX2103214.1 hypothetical protein [Staphylococcus aureus]EKF1403555.1 hypothetical protein [Staphylococcus aureus]
MVDFLLFLLFLHDDTVYVSLPLVQAIANVTFYFSF